MNTNVLIPYRLPPSPHPSPLPCLPLCALDTALLRLRQSLLPSFVPSAFLPSFTPSSSPPPLLLLLSFSSFSPPPPPPPSSLPLTELKTNLKISCLQFPYDHDDNDDDDDYDDDDNDDDDNDEVMKR